MPDPLPAQTPASQDVAPASQRGAGGVGCWRVGGVTCGVLFSLFGVLFLVFFLAARPRLGSVMTAWRQAVWECPAQLYGERGLQGALQRYRLREGEYPARLLDLYPRYVTRRSAFHCPADPADESTVSYRYRRPAPDAPAETVVLICDHHTLPGTHVRLLVPIEGVLDQEITRLPNGRER